MKKLVLLFSMITLVFMSCSSDDDGGSNDSIVGTWKYYKYIENGVEEELDLCENEETLIFAENGDFTGMDYMGNCILVDTFTGTWTSSGSIYSITSEGETNSAEVIFEGNTFYIEDTYNNGIEDITSREVYIKQ